ncbi:MAG TPA: hypothetical protein VJQ25_12275, partial [Nitrospira sp.]|nr:hypothetical protein [Nitrospira sp.]
VACNIAATDFLTEVSAVLAPIERPSASGGIPSRYTPWKAMSMVAIEASGATRSVHRAITCLLLLPFCHQFSGLRSLRSDRRLPN